MGRKVLVVEDDEVLRSLTVEIISLLDVDVLECKSADAALSVLEGTSISLVLTDIHMPGSMSGIEMARVMSARWPTLPFIVTSGNLSVADGKMPPRAVFLRKPYGMDALHDAVRKLIPTE